MVNKKLEECMKKNKISVGIVVAVMTLLWSCGQQQPHESMEVYDMAAEEESMPDASELSYALSKKSEPNANFSESNDQNPAPETYISSSAALENPHDTTRKVIRTADIKFKVKDVIKATYNIEDIVVRQNGFVEHTNLTSQINYTQETRIKEDSTLITTYYSVINTLILRVPNTQLDTTLKEIAQFVDFMDYRIINAKNVALDLLSKKLEQNRLEKYDNRMKNAIDNKGRKLDDISSAENNLLHKQAQADEAKLANLQIIDKIKFSTITLSLYQNQSIKYETVAREKKIESYSVPFGVRLVDAIQFGWTVIVEICLFLINIWSIILIAGVVFWGVKYFRKKIKNM